MPTRSSVCDAPWYTWAASGMRSITIRLAAAASGALRAVIPFASRATMALFTRTSSALVPHRRVSDPSGSTWTSLIIRNLLPGYRYTCDCKYLILGWLHMQVLSEADGAARFDRIVTKEVAGRRVLRAWDVQ